jgi:hypothetical protein
MSAKDQPPNKAVRIDHWGFEEEAPEHPRIIYLLGLFLIALGLAMVAGEAFRAAHFSTSVFFLAIGLVLLASWLRDRTDLALYAGIFLTTTSLASLLDDLGVIHGSGWGTLFLGIGILALIPIRARADRGWGGPAVLGGLLALWGGSEVAGQYLNIPADRLVGPLLLVLLGLYLVIRARPGRGV